MLLAGNLDISISDGLLTIQGDDHGNVASITQLNNEKLVVTGFGTTLNGGQSALVFDSVNSIYANLKGGDDILGISRSELPFDSVLSAIATASKFQDLKTQVPLSLPGDVTIIAGPGNDALAAVVKLEGGLSIHAGEGTDEVNLTNTTVERSIQIQAGSGDSIVKLQSCFARSAITLNLGSGKDVVATDDVQAIANTVQSSGAVKDPMQSAAPNNALTLRSNTSDAQRTRFLEVQSNAGEGRPTTEPSQYEQPYPASTPTSKVRSDAPDTFQAPAKVVSISPNADSLTIQPMEKRWYTDSAEALRKNAKPTEAKSQLIDSRSDTKPQNTTKPSTALDEVFAGLGAGADPVLTLEAHSVQGVFLPTKSAVVVLSPTVSSLKKADNRQKF